MLEPWVLKSTKSCCGSWYVCAYECICYVYMYLGMYICIYLCMYMLYLVWPFDSLYYCDKLRSGIYLWKTTVVCQPQLSVNLKVNWGIAGETQDGGNFQKRNQPSTKLCLLRRQISGFNFEWKTGQADFIDWMSFLPSNLMEEINPTPTALRTNA